MGKKFNVEDFGDSSIEQVENMKFTKEEKLILEYAFSLEDFSDEDYFNLAFYFAENNGLN